MKMNRRGTRVAVAHWKWRWFMIFSAFMRLVYFIINFHVNIWKQLYFMRSVSPYCINQVCPTPQKWGFAPPLPRPVKMIKTCGAQRGKVDFNPMKFGRQLQGRIQFCPINICLTHKSVDLRTFLSRHAPPHGFFPCPAPPCPALHTFTFTPPRPLA